MHRTFLSLVAVVAVAALLVAQPQAQNAQSTASARPAATPSAAVINLNTAAVSDLQRLPGIDAKTAARTLEYREKKGPFKKIEEILENHSSYLYLFIGATTTTSGLKVKAILDTTTYEPGEKLGEAAMRMLHLKPHDFHGDWNYTLQPRPTA